jgi:hypothetical protein
VKPDEVNGCSSANVCCIRDRVDGGNTSQALSPESISSSFP